MSGNAELVAELRVRLERIRDRQAEHEALLGSLTAAQAELAAITASATSPDGAVTVVAGPGGIVRSVQLAEHALHHTAAALSAVIDATVRQAVAQAAREQLAIVRDRVGDRVDPKEILGPQAMFAELAEPPVATAPVRRTDPDIDEDGPPTILARR
jgi:DNA-binding protein YbaB